MKIAPVADLKARLSSYLERCAEGPIVVTKNGRPRAVLIGVSDEEELERLVLAHTPRFRAMLEAADRRIDKSGGILHEEFWKAAQPKGRGRRASVHAKKPKSPAGRARRRRPRPAAAK
jgi:prevent-host-death family protein